MGAQRRVPVLFLTMNAVYYNITVYVPKGTVNYANESATKSSELVSGLRRGGDFYVNWAGDVQHHQSDVIRVSIAKRTVNGPIHKLLRDREHAHQTRHRQTERGNRRCTGRSHDEKVLLPGRSLSLYPTIEWCTSETSRDGKCGN